LVNYSEQRDCNEFAGQLFEQLENELKSTPNKGLLDDSFRGMLMHQFISKDCSHVSEREEPFYMLSVTVKNKTTIQQALEAYITVILLPDFPLQPTYAMISMYV
jgi:ubiquitin carboxyl-terminal hydrolase 34